MVNQYCAQSFARNWQLPFLNQRKGENDHRKYFMINLHVRMLPTSAGGWTRNLLVSSWTAHPTEPPRPANSQVFCSKIRVAFDIFSAKILVYLPCLMIKVLMICSLTTSLVLNKWALVFYYYRNDFYFSGFYRCENTSKSLTNWIKPTGFYIKFASDLLASTHR